MIGVIGDMIIDKIIQEIKEARYFTILLEETGLSI